jgi:hypothetical protein
MAFRQTEPEVMKMPPAALHAVWTQKGCIVVNSTFSMVEGLEAMARVIRKWLILVLGRR